MNILNNDYKQYGTMKQQPMQFKQPIQTIPQNIISKSPQIQLLNDNQVYGNLQKYNIPQQTNISSKAQFQPSVNEKNFNISNLASNYLTNTKNNEQNNLSNKQFESSSSISSTINQLDYLNKQYTTQKVQQNYLQDTASGPLQQQKLIMELTAQIDSLKKEHHKQMREKDEKIFKLSLDNRQLQDQVKNQQTQIIDLEKRLEEQKHQRRQRQREEQEIQRQLAYMMAIEQMEGLSNQPRQQQYPDVDNMTYEELINLGDQIGSVSKGMKQEDIMKIKEIKYDKNKMRENCTMCSVCQCDFESSEKVKELNPCKHIYHPDCINKWLENEKNCPVCKQMIQV